MRTISKTIFMSLAVMASTTAAVADDTSPAPPAPPPGTDGGTGTPGKVASPNEPGQPLPDSQSDHDAQPQVASPNLPTGGLVSREDVDALG